jgi:hypothetical protein
MSVENNYPIDSDKSCVNTIFPLKYDYGQKLHPIFNCELVKSIRAKHANLTMIAEYEENDLFEYYCCASDTELEGSVS